MITRLILNFIADDRPGLVDMLSQAITEAGGSWTESRTAHMAGKFAGIILAELPDREKAEALKAKLAGMESAGLVVSAADAPGKPASSGAALVINLVGPDQPGIVRDIAHYLAVHGASIENMDTHTSEAPMGGGILFHAHIDVRAPAGLDEETLRGELEQIAGALMVDLDLRDPARGA